MYPPTAPSRTQNHPTRPTQSTRTVLLLALAAITLTILNTLICGPRFTGLNLLATILGYTALGVAMWPREVSR